MPIFHLTGVVTVSARTDVMAKTLEEAIAIAEDYHVDLQTNMWGGDVFRRWVIEDADGEVQEIAER